MYVFLYSNLLRIYSFTLHIILLKLRFDFSEKKSEKNRKQILTNILGTEMFVIVLNVYH